MADQFDPSTWDDQTLATMANIVENHPADRLPDARQRNRVMAEVYRRKAGLPAPQNNVDANLEASASPLTPEPTLGPRRTSAMPTAMDLESGEYDARREWGDREIAGLRQDGPSLRPGTDAWDAQELQLNGAPFTMPDEQAVRQRQQREQGRYRDLKARGLMHPMQEDGRSLESHAEDMAEANLASAREAMSDAEFRAHNARERARYGVRGMGAPALTHDQQANRAERQHSENRVRTAPGVEERRIIRMAKAAGVTVEKAREMVEAGYEGAANEGETPTFSQFAKAHQGLRDAASTRRNADAEGRSAAWKAQAMLAGGQPTGGLGGSRAAVTAMRMAPKDQQGNITAYWATGGSGATPLDVERAHNAQMTELGLRVAQGQGFRGGGPMEAAQAQLAQEQVNAERRKTRSVDEDVLGEKYAPGDTNILPWWLGGGYDEFTIDEQQKMFDDLIAQGYTLPEAQRAVDAQANKRQATDKAPRRREAT